MAQVVQGHHIGLARDDILQYELLFLSSAGDTTGVVAIFAAATKLVATTVTQVWAHHPSSTAPEQRFCGSP